MYRIIYPNNNSISIIVPSSSCPMNINDIAKQYVPSGLRYKIISIDDIPNDRTFREAWTYDFDDYDGIGENTNHD